MAGIMRTCAREIVANALMGIPFVAARRVRAGRTSLPAGPEHIRRFAFSIILDNPIGPLIPGSDVLEIGPGDHLATGLAFLAYGARSYTAVDRFTGNYGGEHARAWYRLVRQEWSRYFDVPWRDELDAFPEIPAVHTLQAAIEDVTRLPERQYDLVVSQAVGEHVQDIDAFAAGTFRLLRDGGAALHNIDFSSHGLFNDTDTFRKIPERIWRLMGSNRGLPNRKTAEEFDTAFSHYPFRSIEQVSRSETWASFLLVREESIS